MSKVQSIAIFVALGFIVHFIAGTMQQASNNGFSDPHTISFDQLVDEGPGQNMYVSVDDFVPGTPIPFYGGEHNCTFVPVFKTWEEADDGRSVELVLCFDGLFSEPDLVELQEILSSDESRILGMVTRNLRFDGHLRAIAQMYPGRTLDARIVDIGSAPEGSYYYISWLLQLVAFAANVLFVFWACRAFKFSKSLGIQIGLLIVGGCVTAGGAWYRLTQPLDFSTPDGLLNAAAIEAGIGVGLGCTLAAIMMIVLKENFFAANPFGGAEIAVDQSMLTIAKGSKVREIPFEGIEAVNLVYQTDQQHVTGNRPDFKLEVISRGEKIVAKGVLEDGQGPHMQSQIDLIVDYLAQRYIKQIKDGHVVAFDNWSIQGDMLSVETAKKDIKQASLNQINAVEHVDANYQIWVAGNVQHVAEVPIRGQNSEVLREILTHFIDLTQSTAQLSDIGAPSGISDHASAKIMNNPGIAGSSENNQISSPLGRLIFEDIQNHMNGYAVAACSVGVGGALGYFVNPLVGVAIGGLGISIGVIGQLSDGSGKKCFRVHELGVSLDQKGKVTELAYEDVETFSYLVTHIYNSGAYAGTRYEIEFVGGDDSSGESPKIKLSSVQKTGQFDKMQQVATEQIGMKLAAELAETDRVQWIPGCFIHKDGIEVPVRSGLSKNIEKVTWDRIRSAQANSGKMLIKIDDDKSASIKLDVSKPNFFPGYFLVEKMLEMHHVSLEPTFTNEIESPMSPASTDC